MPDLFYKLEIQTTGQDDMPTAAQIVSTKNRISQAIARKAGAADHTTLAPKIIWSGPEWDVKDKFWSLSGVLPNA